MLIGAGTEAEESVTAEVTEKSRNETLPTSFRVEVAFLAGSGGSKGGTGMGNSGKV